MCPAFRHRQVVECGCQPIIAQITGLHRVTETSAQGPLVSCDPRLDTIEPAVTLREDASQPDERRLAETQALPIPIGEEVSIQ